MLIAVDIDGTIDAYPVEFCSILQALRAAGHQIVVVTGGNGEVIDPAEVEGRVQFLEQIGLGECYDELAVMPEPHDENKAAYCAARKVDMLFDNSKDNAKAYAKVCAGPVFVPWQTRK